MRHQEPTTPIKELVPILGRSQTTISWWARRYGIGRHAIGQAWRFTAADIERLRQVFQCARAPGAQQQRF